jgi:hypothetical protein
MGYNPRGVIWSKLQVLPDWLSDCRSEDHEIMVNGVRREVPNDNYVNPG